MKIVTDHKWKHFKYGYEVPKKVMKDQFDWMDEDQVDDGFICYRGTWYHAGEFMRIVGNPDKEFSKYHGYHSDSFFSGVLVKLSDDGEAYQIATYYA